MLPAFAVPLACLSPALALGSVWLAAEVARRPGGGAHAVPGLEPLDARTAMLEGHRVVPALLMAVYDAFGSAEEAEVYDTLATVATGDALEALCSGRMGATAGGGLDASDQAIHEIRPTELAFRSRGEAAAMEARWQVIGRAVHTDHEHVRGKVCAARPMLRPVKGAWRIAELELLDVDHTLAGTPAEADPS